MRPASPARVQSPVYRYTCPFSIPILAPAGVLLYNSSLKMMPVRQLMMWGTLLAAFIHLGQLVRGAAWATDCDPLILTVLWHFT